jgi:hypothetical protein
MTYMEEVRDFYFQGAEWALTQQGTPIRLRGMRDKRLSGWRQAVYRNPEQHHDLKFWKRWGSDGWLVITSTIISDRSQPVWMMCTSGLSYKEEIQSFVDEAVIARCRMKDFFGSYLGRSGWSLHMISEDRDGRPECEFERFRGREMIHYPHPDASIHGYRLNGHVVWGGSLVSLPIG